MESDSDSDDSALDDYVEIGSHNGGHSDSDIFEESTVDSSYCKGHPKKKSISPRANVQTQKKLSSLEKNSIKEEWMGFSPSVESQNNPQSISKTGSSMSEYRQMESDDSLPDLSEEINYKAPKSGWLTTGARTPPTSKGTQKTITLTEEKDYLTKVQKRENSKKTLGKTSSSLSHYSKMESDDSLPDVSEESNYTQPKSGWLTARKSPPPTSKETQKAITATVEKEFLTEEQKRGKSKKTSGTTCSSALNECFEIESDSDSIADIFDESSYKQFNLIRSTKRKGGPPRSKGKRQKKTGTAQKKSITVGTKAVTTSSERAVSRTKSQKNSEKTVAENQIGKPLRTNRKIPLRRNQKGETPLHRACIKGNLERVKDLIKSGHPVNAQDYVGWTPLHEAANFGHLETVNYLLDYGADIDHRGDAGITPLIDAASCGHVQMMQLLIERGANKFYKSDKNQTALDTLVAWQKTNARSDAGFLSIYKEVVKRLGKTADQRDFKSKCIRSTEQSKSKQLLGASPPSYMRTISDTDVLHSRDDYADSVTDSDNESETSIKPATGDRLTGDNSENGDVTLIIPSKRIFTYSELAEVHRELDKNSEQCVVWPSLDQLEFLADEHLPHIILDIVMCIREDKMDNLAAILSNVKVEKYNYALMHSQSAFQKFFFDIVDDLADVNKQRGRKVGWLMSQGNMKVLIIYLSDKIPGHKTAIASVHMPLYKWNNSTSSRDISKQPTKTKEEFDKIWRWLMNKIRTSYKIEIFPDRQSHSSMEKMLFSHEFSAMVTVDLINKLSYLRECIHDTNDCSVSVSAIDGADRNVLKYQTLVRKAITTITQDSSCKEMFYILSVEKSDDMHEVSDILPPQLVESANVYTAFDPQKVRPSCIIIHSKLAELKRPCTSGSRCTGIVPSSSSRSPVGARSSTSKCLR